MRVRGTMISSTVRMPAASDATAQLMELGKPETVRAFNEHHGCVGNVDAHFDNGCRNQHVDLAITYDRVLVTVIARGLLDRIH